MQHLRRVARGTLRLGMVVVLAVVMGNVAILGLSLVARHTTATPRLELAGVDNGVVVDRTLWRGAAPTAEGYRTLADAGVTTVVDLRSDSERGEAVEALDDLPVEVVRIPIRDGQLPTVDDVQRFLKVVADADGTVFLHCGAGVGRTGAMVAAYEQAVDGLGGMETLRRNLAIGPPSLEQIMFAVREGDRPGLLVTSLSRVLDAPRRIWHNLT